ncbi:hypothetical protein P7266_1047 [Lactococcus cremoris]|nr:hypothetical protein P7266_1047 [Lactococcus cremoris]
MELTELSFCKKYAIMTSCDESMILHFAKFRSTGILGNWVFRQGLVSICQIV